MAIRWQSDAWLEELGCGARSKSWSVQQDRGVGGGNEIKEPDYGARSCSEVVELEWLQQVWQVVSINVRDVVYGASGGPLFLSFVLHCRVVVDERVRCCV